MEFTMKTKCMGGGGKDRIKERMGGKGGGESSPRFYYTGDRVWGWVGPRDRAKRSIEQALSSR